MNVSESKFTLVLKENGIVIFEQDLRSHVADIMDLDSEKKGIVWKFNTQRLEVTLIPKHVAADDYVTGLKNLSLSGSLIVRFLK